jgi:hypothetical protein
MRLSNKGDTTVTNSKIVLSLALVLGTASGAIAATKHPIHQQRAAVEQQVPAGGESYGSARQTPSEPAYMRVQDRDLNESNGF